MSAGSRLVIRVYKFRSTMLRASVFFFRRASDCPTFRSSCALNLELFVEILEDDVMVDNDGFTEEMKSAVRAQASP